jgi:glycosyltransferase involved in cell wall biosynthesis
VQARAQVPIYAEAVPDIAVIVPAHNARATLGRTLAALDRLEGAGDHEVIVVDDASSDATADVAERHGARLVRLGSQRGPAEARNAGVAATDADLLAFTDADCEPSPGWLRELRAGLERADLVRGPVLPDPWAAAGPFDRTLRLPGPSWGFETANLAVRRQLFDALGGFEAFAPRDGHAGTGLRPRVDQGHFGEDALFGWRAVRRRARVGFAPHAVVHHAVFPRRGRAYVAAQWRARFFPTLVRELPEMRAELPLRVFLSRRSALFDLALSGMLVALALRRPWPATAALPYARRCLWPMRPWRSSVLRINLALIAADAVTLVALLRGSAAARRLLL